MDRGKTSNLHTKPASADYCLDASDIEKFRPERSKNDILKDVQWGGDFEEATEYEGKNVSAISYGLFGGPYRVGGRAVWAIFVGDKFKKFVRWPEWDQEEVIDDSGKRRSRAKPIKIGDFRRLIRAVESKPVSVADLEKEVRAGAAPPQHIDVGLTAAYLALEPALSAKRNKEINKNAALRDHYNASRLRIGMTESEVESVLRAQALESGKVEAGSYKIYGSNESFDIDYMLHFSNILVIFKEGKVIGIHRAPAGYEWRRTLGELFIDLPASH
ncbi:MAG: hypothetical protein ACLQLG_13100 [Thermoguttaceae bacterium]